MPLPSRAIPTTNGKTIIFHNRNGKKGVLNEGDPNCIHTMQIKTENTNPINHPFDFHYYHEIGRCKCGRIVDYTFLQNIYNNNSPKTTLDRIEKNILKTT